MFEMILRELGTDQSSGSHQGGHDHPAEGGVARTGGRFLPVVHQVGHAGEGVALLPQVADGLQTGGH